MDALSAFLFLCVCTPPIEHQYIYWRNGIRESTERPTFMDVDILHMRAPDIGPGSDIPVLLLTYLGHLDCVFLER